MRKKRHCHCQVTLESKWETWVTFLFASTSHCVSFISQSHFVPPSMVSERWMRSSRVWLRERREERWNNNTGDRKRRENKGYSLRYSLLSQVPCVTLWLWYTVIVPAPLSLSYAHWALRYASCESQWKYIHCSLCVRSTTPQRARGPRKRWRKLKDGEKCCNCDCFIFQCLVDD